MVKQFKPGRVKTHHTCTIAEWADVLGVHKNSIWRWIKHEGLRAVVDQKPFLIRGVDLKEFLENRAKRRKQPCGIGRIYCFGCRKPREPAGRMLDYVADSANSGRLRGLCPVCESWMNRAIRKPDIPVLFPECDVTITTCDLTLSHSTDHPVNGDILGSSHAIAEPTPNVIAFPSKRSA